MDNLARETALSGVELERAGFCLRERAGLGLIRLQTFHRKPGAVESLSQSLGMNLPGPGETSTVQDMQIFWSAPGEWILAVAEGSEPEVVNDLQAKLDGLLAVLSVITDSRVALDIGGAAARDVLARGSTVDFHASEFGAGRCLNTRFAGVPVMLACADAGDSFLLFADRSVVHYLREWFDAASSDC